MSRGTLWHFVGYFCLLLTLGVFVRDIASQPPLTANIHSFIQYVQMGDPKSFASGALDVHRNGWFTLPNRWLIHLWPPGFMVLEASILSVLGEQAPFMIVLLALACLFQAFMLVTLRRLLLPLVPAVAASLLPLVPYAFPVTRVFLLEPSGLILGESFAIGFYITGALLLFLSYQERRLMGAVAGGLFLGLSAYFRSNYGTLLVMTTALAVPILLWLLVRYLRETPQSAARPVLRQALKTVVIGIVAANALMLPWRIHNQLWDGKMAWVYTPEEEAKNNFMTTEELMSLNAGWVVAGGGNVACLVAPELCGQRDPKLFYPTFFKHMGPWMSRKYALLDEYWFHAIENWANPLRRPTIGEWVANGLNLLFLLAAFPLMWLTRRHPMAPVLLWVLGSFFACFWAVFTLAHLECRYMFVVKIFAVVGTILLASMAWHERTERRRTAV